MFHRIWFDLMIFCYHQTHTDFVISQVHHFSQGRINNRRRGYMLFLPFKLVPSDDFFIHSFVLWQTKPTFLMLCIAELKCAYPVCIWYWAGAGPAVVWHQLSTKCLLYELLHCHGWRLPHFLGLAKCIFLLFTQVFTCILDGIFSVLFAYLQYMLVLWNSSPVECFGLLIVILW